MTVVAVICEYNLFHSGHARLISKIRERFGEDTAVISLMSGHFTQRGDVAACDKYTRAGAAMLCGSDAVIELPLPFSCSVGEIFARSSVNILNSLGVVDYLAFGSESGDLEKITETAKNQLLPEFEEKIKEELAKPDKEESYIRLRERVYESMFGKRELLPNDTLALEYVTALILTDSKIKPFAVKREGKETATASRALYLSGDYKALSSLVPQKLLDVYKGAVPHCISYASRAVLFALRTMDSQKAGECFGAQGGICERIISSAKDSGTVNELYNKCVTKKYTEARIKRCVISMLLGITEKDVFCVPDKVLLLSANDRGCAVASEIRKNGSVSLVTRGSMTYGTLEARADALYSLCTPEPEKCGEVLRKNPYILK